MPPTLPRTLAALTALTFVLGTTTACSDDASQAATTGAASASTSNASTPAPSSGTSSTTPSTGQSADSSQSTTPASPTVATEDPKYVSAPAPGSTWTPPPLTTEQVQGNQNARDHGYEVNYQDPATFPLPAEKPAEPAMQAYGFEKTDLGASEGARYYLRALEYAINTGDREYVNRITLDSCSTCLAPLDEIEGSQGKSGFASVGPITSPKSMTTRTSSDEAFVNIDVNYPEVTIFNPEIGMVVKTPSHSGEWKFKMLWNERGYWAVENIEFP